MASDSPVQIDRVWRGEADGPQRVVRVVARAGEVWASWNPDVLPGIRMAGVNLGSRWGATPTFTVGEARALVACLQRVLAEVEEAEEMARDGD